MQRNRNGRVGKTRDLFKKIRDIKGTFHAKMGTIRDRSCMALTRKGGNNVQKYILKKKKNLNDPDNHNGVITHLE